ncbi:MAG: ATP-grasp domain-containing protein [Acidobacteria bacterium]|nr:ATP-grasp domain-containing protein [Acidobacteriota bacterium]
MSEPSARKQARVLVLDSDCAAGVECVQSLGRFGARVDAASANSGSLAFVSRYAHRKLIQPGGSALLPWLDQIGWRDYDLIIPATEVSLLCFAGPDAPAELRERAMLAPREGLRTALSKEATWQAARELSIPTPASVVVRMGARPPAEFPVVLKPVHSKTLQGEHTLEHRVVIARNAEQWAAALEAKPELDFQQQEYVAGRGVGIECLLEHGQLRWAFAHERVHEYPLTGGGSSYRKSIPLPQDLLDMSRRLLGRLRWHGVAMVEFKVTESGAAYLVEINPRFWGSLALAIDAGVDFPAGLLMLATGQPLPPQPAYRAGHFTRNLERDVKWQVANLKAYHDDPLLLTRPRLRSVAELARPLWGRESWDHFSWRDLRVTVRVLWRILAEWLGRGAGFLRQIDRMARKAWIRLGLPLRGPYVRLVHHPRVLSRCREAQTVLFVCWGNICRSPLAAELARGLMPECRMDSAGGYRVEGRGSVPEMLAVAAECGVDLSRHRSQRVTREMLDRNDLIIVMDTGNYRFLWSHFPEALNKTTFLGLFGERPVMEIRDPFGESLEHFREAASHIRKRVEALARWRNSAAR